MGRLVKAVSFITAWRVVRVGTQREREIETGTERQTDRQSQTVRQRHTENCLLFPSSGYQALDELRSEIGKDYIEHLLLHNLQARYIMCRGLHRQLKCSPAWTGWPMLALSES